MWRANNFFVPWCLLGINLLLKRDETSHPRTKFGILAFENSASECCIGLFLLFLSRSFIISIRMFDCSILALSDVQGYIH